MDDSDDPPPPGEDQQMQEKSPEEIDGKETGKAAASVPREERQKEAGFIGEEADIETDKQEKTMDVRSEAGTEEVSWPVGAIEETEYDQETREQVEAAQEEMENNVMDDKAKNVVTTSKMFSKIRNRIKTKPLKIQLKTNKLSTEENEGIERDVKEEKAAKANAAILNRKNIQIQLVQQSNWWAEQKTKKQKKKNSVRVSS